MNIIKEKIEDAIKNNHRITVFDHLGNVLEDVIPVSYANGILKTQIEENSDIIEFFDVYSVEVHKD